MSDGTLQAASAPSARQSDGLLTWARSILFNGVFYLWSFVLALAMLPTLLGPPSWVISWCRLWHRGTRFWLRLICGIRVEVRGAEHIPSGPALVAAKHQCTFDAFAPITELARPTIVAKQELAAIPLFGSYGARSRLTLSVDRGGHAKALRHMIAEGRRALADGRQLVIYPEGTRSVPGSPPAYKPGVAGLYAQLDAPCTPVATNAGTHWLPGRALRRPGVIVFQYLPPIPPGLKRAEFMRELETRIETATNALLAERL